MKAKNGDHVINYSLDEGIVSVGIVSNVNEEYDECDLDLYDGGSISPVNLSECYVVPEALSRLVGKLMDTCPTDAGGMFIFKEA